MLVRVARDHLGRKSVYGRKSSKSQSHASSIELQLIEESGVSAADIAPRAKLIERELELSRFTEEAEHAHTQAKHQLQCIRDEIRCHEMERASMSKVKVPVRTWMIFMLFSMVAHSVLCYKSARYLSMVSKTAMDLVALKTALACRHLVASLIGPPYACV